MYMQNKIFNLFEITADPLMILWFDVNSNSLYKNEMDGVLSHIG